MPDVAGRIKKADLKVGLYEFQANRRRVRLKPDTTYSSYIAFVSSA